MILFFWAIGGFIGYAAAQKKGFSTVGGMIGGFLLGPIFAWLLFLVSGVTGDDQRAKCPHCAEFIKLEARVCKHCRRDVQAPTAPLAPAPTRPVARSLVPPVTEPTASALTQGLWVLVFIAGGWCLVSLTMRLVA
jgi:hypothetical protein